MDNKIVIKIGPNRNLVAVKGCDTQYKEIFLCVEDDEGNDVRDLAVVRPSYEYDKNSNVVTLEGSYDILLRDIENQDYNDPIVYKEVEREE